MNVFILESRGESELMCLSGAIERGTGRGTGRGRERAREERPHLFIAHLHKPAFV